MDKKDLKDLEGDEFLDLITKCIDASVSQAELFPEVGLDCARALGRLGDVQGEAADDYGCHGEDVVDACAVGMMKCLESYAPVCKDWGPVVDVMEKTSQHAVCEDTMDAAERNLSIVKANYEHQKLHATCWACKEETATEDDTFVVKMFKKIRGGEDTEARIDANGNEVHEKVPWAEWRTVGISIPLCHSCAMRRQSREREIMDRIWFCESYLDIMKTSFPDGFEQRADETRIKRDHYKDMLAANGHYADFPEVKKLLADGYEFGVQPEENRPSNRDACVLGRCIEHLECSPKRPMPSIINITRDGVAELEYPCD